MHFRATALTQNSGHLNFDRSGASPLRFPPAHRSAHHAGPWSRITTPCNAAQPINFKTCKQCGQCKPYADFYTTAVGAPFARCKLCCLAYRRASYLANPHKDNAQARQRLLADPRVRMAAAARNRDKAKGLASDIQAAPITIPKLCPVLGIPLVAALGKASAGSPSIDHLDPKNGAVMGNWRVISYRANALKGGRTADSLAAFVQLIELHRCQPGARRRRLRGDATLDGYRAVHHYLKNCRAAE